MDSTALLLPQQSWSFVQFLGLSWMLLTRVQSLILLSMFTFNSALYKCQSCLHLLSEADHIIFDCPHQLISALQSLYRWKCGQTQVVVQFPAENPGRKPHFFSSFPFLEQPDSQFFTPLPFQVNLENICCVTCCNSSFTQKLNLWKNSFSLISCEQSFNSWPTDSQNHSF